MVDNFSDIDLFFWPRSIAVLGASENLSSFGTRYLQALTNFGFRGRIFAVNRSGNVVLGHDIYRSVLDLTERVDLAVISVPSRFAPDALQDCLRAGIKAAIILGSGFSETDSDEGRILEEELLRISRQGIRLMGPNCFGTYSPGGRLTIIPGQRFPVESGGIGLITQSGQLSEMIVGRSAGEGIRFSNVASFGNACDINESDLIEYLYHDGETKVVAAYLEGVKQGRRLFDIVSENSKKKPTIIWKAGLTSAGSAAAKSHTGSLAGSSNVWDAFFRQTSAIQVLSLEELIDAMIGFSCLPKGCGTRVGLVSGGGAGAVIGADVCERTGLQMLPMPSDIKDKLRAILPASGTAINNPLDLGVPHQKPDIFKQVLESVAAGENVDVIVIRRVFFSEKLSQTFSDRAGSSAEELKTLLNVPIEIKKQSGKPVVVILAEELTGVNDLELEKERREIRDFFFKNQIPVFPTEARAFKTIANMAKYNLVFNAGQQI
jgi:acyl-CoA synthetase (NDP forming)